MTTYTAHRFSSPLAKGLSPVFFAVVAHSDDSKEPARVVDLVQGDHLTKSGKEAAEVAQAFQTAAAKMVVSRHERDPEFPDEELGWSIEYKLYHNNGSYRSSVCIGVPGMNGEEGLDDTYNHWLSYRARVDLSVEPRDRVKPTAGQERALLQSLPQNVVEKLAVFEPVYAL
jgi:hypothetical protein